MQAVATSPPDGYTLLMGTFANAVNPSLQSRLPYDVHGDFAAVALVARSFNIVVVNPASPIKSIADLIAAARAEPGKLTNGTYSTGASGGRIVQAHGQGRSDDSALQGKIGTGTLQELQERPFRRSEMVSGSVDRGAVTLAAGWSQGATGRHT